MFRRGQVCEVAGVLCYLLLVVGCRTSEQGRALVKVTAWNGFTYLTRVLQWHSSRFRASANREPLTAAICGLKPPLNPKP